MNHEADDFPKTTVFPDTRWTRVRNASGPDEMHDAGERNELCKDYWYPIYAFLRRSGHSPHDAEDSTQKFFAYLLSANLLSKADPAKGRFRTYLLTCLKNRFFDEIDRANAQKRDVRRTVSFDAADAEGRYLAEPSHLLSPDRLFDETWALTQVAKAVERMDEKYKTNGGLPDNAYRLLRQYMGEGKLPPGVRAKLAVELATTEQAISNRLARLNQEWTKTIRAVVRETLPNATDAGVEEELRMLFGFLSKDKS
jgi:RNA polymerase sigma factor (sigma-70 family)